MEVLGLLSKEQADAIFDREAVMICSMDAIPDYRVADLFGQEVCRWAEHCMGMDQYLQIGEDWCSYGEKECHFYRSGFYKIVGHHNYLECKKHRNDGEGGKIWDDLWKARHEALEAAEREEDRKREERKAKREASRKAKQQGEAARNAELAGARLTDDLGKFPK